MKNIILTTAINYDYEKIKLFLNSLNNFYTGELVIISDRDYKIKHLNYQLKIIKTSESLVKKICGVNINTANNFRYPLYLDYLKKNYYDNILITDARDVVIQADAFERIDDDLLYVAVEDNIIGNCCFNSDWIKTIYNEDLLEKMRDQQIICSGTTMGKYAVIKEYLTYISSQIIIFGKKLDSENKSYVLDQGIHNYYCMKFADRVKRFTNSSNLFLTLGYSKALKLNQEGFFVNEQGKEYAVIHQFDRMNWLSNHLEYQLKDSLKKNNSLNLSFKKGIIKNIKELIRYFSLKES